MKKLFNKESADRAGYESIIGGNPSGLLNMNQSKYSWALKIYKQMKELDWHPEEVNTAVEAKNYEKLSEYEKRMFDLAFAQLSFDDALQADSIQLINQLISNKVVSACIHRISYEEVNHSTSYAVLLQDTTNNADRVFELYKTDEKLAAKNKWISEKYEKYYLTSNVLMLAVMAQIVEGIVFLAGFVAIFSIGQKMVASAQMVAYISKDEINSHLPFFSNVVKTILRENPELQLYKNEIEDLILEATMIEIDWLNYITENVLGFTSATIEEFVKSVADDRLIALGFSKMFNAQNNHLNKLLDSYTKVNDKRSNFFESKSTTYAKNALNMDDF